MKGRIAGGLAVAAHDAGAANHIIALVRAQAAAPVRASMAGPALALWQQAFPGHDATLSLTDALDGVGTLLSGTGWASDFEHQARMLARARGLKVIALVDHWTNYPARFERAGEVMLPDEIWVTDEHALALAGRAFPNLVHVLVPNRYLEGLVAEVAAAQRGGTPPRCQVLYLLEPIRDAWGARAVPGEFAALDFFLSKLERLGAGASLAIRLRPHPSDTPGKYQRWLGRAGAVEVTLDPEPVLAKSLAWAGTVAGCQTYAMVLALAAGKQVFSSVPPGAPPCCLPHAGIKRLADPDLRVPDAPD